MAIVEAAPPFSNLSASHHDTIFDWAVALVCECVSCSSGSIDNSGRNDPKFSDVCAKIAEFLMSNSIRMHSSHVLASDKETSLGMRMHTLVTSFLVVQIEGYVFSFVATFR